MIKWIKRILGGVFTIIVLAIALFVIVKPQPYYILKLLVGSQSQWFGYDHEGNELIKEALDASEYVRASQYHSISVQNTKNGNYDKATEYLDKASDMEPENADGYYGWVLLYYYRDFNKALTYLNKYDSYTPDYDDYVGDDNIHYAKGLCYKGLKDYSKALEHFNLAIESELKDHDENWIYHLLFYQKARTLHLLNRHEEAIALYDKTIDSWERSSESFYYKGLAQLAMNDTVHGLENIETALELIKKGHKTSDSYVELFDEVYQLQIEHSLSNLRNSASGVQ
jgi:tetratricopeptide (TPR) repeat protein